MPIPTGWWPGLTKCTITSSRHSTFMWSPKTRSRSGNDDSSQQDPACTDDDPVDSIFGRRWRRARNPRVVRGRLGRVLPEDAGRVDPRLAFLVFPRITSSSRIDRRDIGRFVLRTQHTSTLPIARQVRELKRRSRSTSPNSARILRVSRPTVYDWLDDGEPNADNGSRIRTLLRLLSVSRVSGNKPLLARLVRSALEPEERSLLELLGEETIDEVTAKNAIRRVKRWVTRWGRSGRSGRLGCGGWVRGGG